MTLKIRFVTVRDQDKNTEKTLDFCSIVFMLNKMSCNMNSENKATLWFSVHRNEWGSDSL